MTRARPIKAGSLSGIIDMTFLLFDDKSEKYFVARRTKDQVKEIFHDMAVGEVRMLSDSVGIIREASRPATPTRPD